MKPYKGPLQLFLGTEKQYQNLSSDQKEVLFTGIQPRLGTNFDFYSVFVKLREGYEALLAEHGLTYEQLVEELASLTNIFPNYLSNNSDESVLTKMSEIFLTSQLGVLSRISTEIKIKLSLLLDQVLFYQYQLQEGAYGADTVGLTSRFFGFDSRIELDSQNRIPILPVTVTDRTTGAKKTIELRQVERLGMGTSSQIRASLPTPPELRVSSLITHMTSASNAPNLTVFSLSTEPISRELRASVGGNGQVSFDIPGYDTSHPETSDEAFLRDYFGGIQDDLWTNLRGLMTQANFFLPPDQRYKKHAFAE